MGKRYTKRQKFGKTQVITEQLQAVFINADSCIEDVNMVLYLNPKIV